MAGSLADQDILARLQEFQLVAVEQVDAVRGDLKPDAQADDILQALVDRRLLTAWQRDELTREKPLILLDNGRYQLQELIGKGGMGSVYRAIHLRMNREVAIKVIAPKYAQDRGVINRFRREVAVSSRLQHEHIVQAHDVGIEGEISFLVLEFVSGSDLAAIIHRDGPMEPAEAAAVCMQAASGLAYAHAQNIVHRDIKPQNILLSTDGVTKILDMGLARILTAAEEEEISALTQEGAIMGTVDFMAPEQAHDTHAADGRSDIYSLGGTFYFVLTGRKPFPGGSAMEKLMRLANEQPPPLGQLRPDCPRELAEIVEKMMAKRPEDRFQTTEEVVRQLQPFAAERISGRPVVTVSVQTAANTQREAGFEHTIANTPVVPAVTSMGMDSFRRRKQQKSNVGWVLGACGLVVALLAGVSFWMFGGHGDNSRSSAETGSSTANETAASAVLPPQDYRIVFDQHFGGIRFAGWSPDGRYLMTTGGDGEIRIWNSSGTRTVAVYSGHRSNVRYAEFSMNGSRIVSCDCTGDLHVWESLTGKQIARIERPSEQSWNSIVREGATLSPDGREVAFFERLNIVRYSLDDRRPVWYAPCSLSQNRREFICYSPDGKYLAAGSTDRDEVHPLVWELPRGDLIYQHTTAGRHAFVGFTGKGQLVVETEKAVELIDTVEGKVVTEWPLEGEFNSAYPPQLYGHGNMTVVRRLDRRDIWFNLNLQTGTSSQMPGPGEMSPDGSLYVTNAKTTEPNLSIYRTDGRASNPAFGGNDIPAPVDLQLLAGRYLRTGWGWFDLKEAKLFRGFPDNSVMLSDGRLRARVDDRILEWSNVAALKSDKFEIVSELAESEQYLRTIDWTGDAQQLWGLGPAENDKRLVRFWNPDDGKVSLTLDISAVSSDLRRSRALVSRDGSVVGAYVDFVHGVWNTQTQMPPQLFRTDYVVPQALHSRGEWFVGRISNSNYSDRFEQLQLYDAKNGEVLSELNTGLGQFYFTEMVSRLSPSDRYVLATRQVWDVSGEEPQRLWECPDWSSAVGAGTTRRNYTNCAWFPDEDHVLICQKAQYQVWNWRENRKLLTFYMLPQRHWAVVNHETKYWTGTPLAFRHLRCLQTADDGTSEWLTAREFEERTGFIRDDTRVGLSMLKSEPK